MAHLKLWLNLDPELKEWVERQAKYSGCSKEVVTTRALKSLKDAKDQMIRESVADADKGVFVSEEKVTAWFLSWDTENELPVPEPDVFLKCA